MRPIEALDPPLAICCRSVLNSVTQHLSNRAFFVVSFVLELRIFRGDSVLLLQVFACVLAKPHTFGLNIDQLRVPCFPLFDCGIDERERDRETQVALCAAPKL